MIATLVEPNLAVQRAAEVTPTLSIVTPIFNPLFAQAFRLCIKFQQMKRKINLQQFKASEVEVKKLLEIKGGSSCVTGSPKCMTNVADKDGDSRGCDTYFC